MPREGKINLKALDIIIYSIEFLDLLDNFYEVRKKNNGICNKIIIAIETVRNKIIVQVKNYKNRRIQ